jgi:hypothetical protein
MPEHALPLGGQLRREARIAFAPVGDELIVRETRIATKRPSQIWPGYLRLQDPKFLQI